MLPLLSTGTGSVMFTGSIPLGPRRTTIGCVGQFWKTGGSLSKFFFHYCSYFSIKHDYNSFNYSPTHGE